MTEELMAAAVRLAVPILLAALGEVIAQRAGIVNIGLEGMMLGGCWAAAAAASGGGTANAGLLAGIGAGLALGALFGLVAVVWRGDLIVTGTGLNLLALGCTSFLHAGRDPALGGLDVAVFPALRVPGLGSLPVLGGALFRQPVTAYLAYLAVPAVWLLLHRTGLGLRWRAAGEEPTAALAAGSSVTRLRFAATVVGGALAGAGGASLVLAHAGTFVEGMTAGRGFVALALVICAGWRPVGVLVAALLFGLASALQFELQALGLALPYQLVRMVPYVATIAVLAVAASPRWRSPAALGK